MSQASSQVFKHWIRSINKVEKLFRTGSTTRKQDSLDCFQVDEWDIIRGQVIEDKVITGEQWRQIADLSTEKLFTITHFRLRNR